MFTGIIEHRGKILVFERRDVGYLLTVASPFQDLVVGESIAVNGVCLTLIPSSAHELTFQLSPETIKRTTFGALAPGDSVHLERAMLASTRFGGHYISGHVDTTATVSSIHPIGEFIEITLSGFEAEACLYLIPKGSISVDGVSLTLNEVCDGAVKLMLVPHTLAQTNLGSLHVGQRVNIEFDYLARIVARQLQAFRSLHLEIAL